MLTSPPAGRETARDSGLRDRVAQALAAGAGTAVTVRELKALGAQAERDGPGATAQFDRPFGLAAESAGNLYVSDYQGNTIRRIVLP